MSSLLRFRLWRALVGLAFLLAMAMPAVAAHYPGAAMMPCATDQATPRKSGCPDHAAKALTCGLAACAGVATVTTEPFLRVERIARTITFPPARLSSTIGLTLPPDPFPPKTLHSA